MCAAEVWGLVPYSSGETPAAQIRCRICWAFSFFWGFCGVGLANPRRLRCALRRAIVVGLGNVFLLGAILLTAEGSSQKFCLF